MIGDLLEERAVKRGGAGPLRATIRLLNESLSMAVAYRPHMRAAANARRSAMETLRSDPVNGAREAQADDVGGTGVPARSSVRPHHEVRPFTPELGEELVDHRREPVLKEVAIEGIRPA